MREAEPVKAYTGGRKPPAKADSASSLHPWVTGGPGSEARSGGSSTPPCSVSPASGSPSPSESNLAHDTAHGHALLRSPMAMVRSPAAYTPCTPFIALSHSALVIILNPNDGLATCRSSAAKPYARCRLQLLCLL